MQKSNHALPYCLAMSKFQPKKICDLFCSEDAPWPLPGSVEAFSLPSVRVTLLDPREGGRRAGRGPSIK
jgi:hypothetical protein